MNGIEILNPLPRYKLQICAIVLSKPGHKSGRHPIDPNKDPHNHAIINQQKHDERPTNNKGVVQILFTSSSYGTLHDHSPQIGLPNYTR